MLRRLVKDSAAETDLIGIWLYTFKHWSVEQADRYLATLEVGIEKLALQPHNGMRRDSIRTDYWSTRIAHHVIFYTFNESEVRIRRVLHEVMDPDLHIQ